MSFGKLLNLFYFVNNFLSIMFVGAGVDALDILGYYKTGATQSISAEQNTGGFNRHPGNVLCLLSAGAKGNKAIVCI